MRIEDSINGRKVYNQMFPYVNFKSIYKNLLQKIMYITYLDKKSIHKFNFYWKVQI